MEKFNIKQFQFQNIDFANINYDDERLINEILSNISIEIAGYQSKVREMQDARDDFEEETKLLFAKDKDGKNIPRKTGKFIFKRIPSREERENHYKSVFTSAEYCRQQYENIRNTSYALMRIMLDTQKELEQFTEENQNERYTQLITRNQSARNSLAICQFVQVQMRDIELNLNSYIDDNRLEEMVYRKMKQLVRETNQKLNGGLKNRFEDKLSASKDFEKLSDCELFLDYYVSTLPLRRNDVTLNEEHINSKFLLTYSFLQQLANQEQGIVNSKYKLADESREEYLTLVPEQLEHVLMKRFFFENMPTQMAMSAEEEVAKVLGLQLEVLSTKDHLQEYLLGGRHELMIERTDDGMIEMTITRKNEPSSMIATPKTKLEIDTFSNELSTTYRFNPYEKKLLNFSVSTITEAFELKGTQKCNEEIQKQFSVFLGKLEGEFNLDFTKNIFKEGMLNVGINGVVAGGEISTTKTQKQIDDITAIQSHSNEVKERYEEKTTHTETSAIEIGKGSIEISNAGLNGDKQILTASASASIGNVSSQTSDIHSFKKENGITISEEKTIEAQITGPSVSVGLQEGLPVDTSIINSQVTASKKSFTDKHKHYVKMEAQLGQTPSLSLESANIEISNNGPLFNVKKLLDRVQEMIKDNEKLTISEIREQLTGQELESTKTEIFALSDEPLKKMEFESFLELNLTNKDMKILEEKLAECATPEQYSTTMRALNTDTQKTLNTANALYYQRMNERVIEALRQSDGSLLEKLGNSPFIHNVAEVLKSNQQLNTQLKSCLLTMRNPQQFANKVSREMSRVDVNKKIENNIDLDTMLQELSTRNLSISSPAPTPQLQGESR